MTVGLPNGNQAVVAQTHDNFRDLLEAAPDAMVIVDASGQIILVNAQAERVFGYPRAEMLGRSIELLVPERFRGRHAEHRRSYAAHPQPRGMGVGRELRGRRKDGSEFQVEISLSPLETPSGTLVMSAIRDITDRVNAERVASHFEAVVESSHDAIIGKTPEGVVTSWNGGAERLYGYSAAEMIGKSVSVLVPPGADDDLGEIMRRIRAGERIEDHETVRARKDGTNVDVSMTVSPIKDPSGAVIGAATIARDITARLRYQEQLRFLAEHDPLTGMRNRRRFERDIAEQVGRARRYGEEAGLLVIDIDGFKRINDGYGHKAGDRALKELAACLRRRLRETDVLARVGGDEFAVLLPYAGREQVTKVAGDLRRVIADCRVEVAPGEHVSLAASIGVAVIDADTESDDAALAEADRAMYADKRAVSA